MAYWDTFESRLEIAADLVAKTAVRVGKGGQAAEPTATDLPVLKDAAGRPYIPGASLRGVLRSHIERIVRTLEEDDPRTPARRGRGACMPTDEDSWCVRRGSCLSSDARYDPAGDYPAIGVGDLRQAAGDDDAAYARFVIRESCRACQVFGSPWLASRVRIADLHADGEAHVEVRPGVSIHREKETVENLYDFETVTAGVRFHLHLTAENLDTTERGLLWLGLRELERGHIHLGGFKGRGLGQVTLENVILRGVEARDRPALRQYLISGGLTELPQSVADAWLEEFVGTVLGGA